MKRIFAIILVFLTGCMGINPRQDQKIDNQSGRIDEIRSNQNGITLDLLKLKQQADIQNSQLKEIQQGMFNLNAAISRNENSGIQILQGDGGLIMIFGVAVVGMLLYYFRNRAVVAEKSVQILSKEIARINDPILNDEVLKSAMNTECEEQIYKSLFRHSKN